MRTHTQRPNEKKIDSLNFYDHFVVWFSYLLLCCACRAADSRTHKHQRIAHSLALDYAVSICWWKADAAHHYMTTNERTTISNNKPSPFGCGDSVNRWPLPVYLIKKLWTQWIFDCPLPRRVRPAPQDRWCPAMVWARAMPSMLYDIDAFPLYSPNEVLWSAPVAISLVRPPSEFVFVFSLFSVFCLWRYRNECHRRRRNDVNGLIREERTWGELI